MRGRRIEQFGELPELPGIQFGEHLIEQYRLSLVAGGLEHEIGAVLAEQLLGLPIYRLDEDGVGELVLARWGLVPAWAKEPKEVRSTFNTRIETVASKPTFGAAYKARRCLVPMDGYYEWRDEGGPRKQRYYLRPNADGVLLTCVGLWERWQSPDGEVVRSFTILTTDAHPDLAYLHPRRPVMLRQDVAEKWLDPATTAGDLPSMMMSADDLKAIKVAGPIAM